MSTFYIAAQQQRVLITYNAEDFQMLHNAWRRWSLAWQVNFTHSGVLITPQPPVWVATRLAEELHKFIQIEPTLTNELYQFRTGSGWTRQPLPRSRQWQS